MPERPAASSSQGDAGADTNLNAHADLDVDHNGYVGQRTPLDIRDQASVAPDAIDDSGMNVPAVVETLEPVQPALSAVINAEDDAVAISELSLDDDAQAVLEEVDDDSVALNPDLTALFDGDVDLNIELATGPSDDLLDLDKVGLDIAEIDFAVDLGATGKSVIAPGDNIVAVVLNVGDEAADLVIASAVETTITTTTLDERGASAGRGSSGEASTESSSSESDSSH